LLNRGVTEVTKVISGAIVGLALIESLGLYTLVNNFRKVSLPTSVEDGLRPWGPYYRLIGDGGSLALDVVT
jgi:hypothetical protein